jgi:hypothetical protein
VAGHQPSSFHWQCFEFGRGSLTAVVLSSVVRSPDRRITSVMHSSDSSFIKELPGQTFDKVISHKTLDRWLILDL